MSPIIAKELAPRNRLERERKLLLLKHSLEQNSYEVDPQLIASGMIQEARDEAAYGQLANS